MFEGLFQPMHLLASSPGGLAPDHSRWISSRRSFFLPVKVLGRVFRGKFVAGLKTAFHAGALQDGERSFFHSVSGCSSHPISQQQTPPRPRYPSLAVAMSALRRNHAVVERLSAAQLLLRSPPQLSRCAA